MSRIVLMLNLPDEPSETFQRSLALHLAEAGHEVVIYAMHGELPADGSLHPRISYSQPVPQPREVGSFVGRLARRPSVSATALRRAVDRWGRSPRAYGATSGAVGLLELEPDVVHVGFSGIGAGLLDTLDLLDGVPLVVSCRGTDELVRPVLDAERAGRLRQLFSQAAIVHCVADAVADAVIELGAPADRVRIVRPAVDLTAWQVGARPAPGPPWRLVTTTRLVAAKGVEDLLAAFAIVVEAGVDATLEVLGGGPQLDALRLRALRSGIDSSVELAGTISSDEVRRRVRAAHLYVSPSLSEGISNGVLEAMASGVPVISTEVGGMAEVIEDGTSGWLVPAGRPDRLAEAIRSALADADGLAATGSAGRARVVASHGSDDQAAAWRAIYDALLHDGQVAGDRDTVRGGHPTP